MADVYLAIVGGLAGFNKLLVIKVMRNTEDPDFVGMFLDEARLAARLHHPNVVQTYEVGQEGERYFLTMEFLNGPTLQRLRQAALAQQKLRLPVALHIVSNILSGLQYTHDLRDYSGAPLGVVHRDLSPHNVMVSFDGECKILDFGIAKVKDASRETQEGIFKGKITYASPEQVRGETLDRRSDLFSVGIILWESIVGASPWGRLNTAAIAQRLGRGEIPKLLSAKPDAPPELARICERALAAAPADRYASAAEFNEELEAFARQLGPPITRRDLSELVAELFDADRKRIQSVIDAQLSSAAGRSPNGAAGAAPLPSLSALSNTPSLLPVGAGATADPQRAAVAAGGAPREPATPPPPPAAREDSIASTASAVPGGERSSVQTVSRPSAPQRKGRSVALALGVAAAAVLIGFALFWPIKKAPDRGGPAAPVPAAEAPSKSRPDSPPVRAEPPAVVDVVISAVPASARLSLDGRELEANPFSGSAPRDGAWHEVLATAKGYRPMTRKVRFLDSISIELALVAEEGAAAEHPSAPTAAPRPSEKPAKPVHPAHAARSSPPAPVPSTAPFAETAQLPGVGAGAVAEPAAEPTRPARQRLEIGDPSPAAPPPPPALTFQEIEFVRRRRIAGSEPSYPAYALKNAIEGAVEARFTIGPDGQITDIVFTKTHPAFERTVREALAGWKFSPHIVNGQPVSVYTIARFTFELE